MTEWHSPQGTVIKISKRSDWGKFLSSLSIIGHNKNLLILASPFWDTATLTCIFWEPWKTNVRFQSILPQIWRIWCYFFDQGSHLILNMQNYHKYGTPENLNISFTLNQGDSHQWPSQAYLMRITFTYKKYFFSRRTQHEMFWWNISFRSNYK